MHRTPAVILSAVTLVAALGLSGCADEPKTVASSSPTTSIAADSAATQALPASDALTNVVAKLADISIPVEQKVALVQYATVDDEATLNNFGEALKASGFDPVTVAAAGIAWSTIPGNVTANVTIATTDPKVDPFSYPMEFSALRDGWQLTRKSADELLPLVDAPRPTPSG